MTELRLAVSNIAWPAEEESAVADELSALGVDSVEIAPTKVFDDPTKVSDAELASYLDFWRHRDIKVVAFQSMLFGRPELALFGDAEVRRATLSRLTSFIDLAGRMGAGVLVFGSPRNRNLPEGASEADVWSEAVDAFGELGEAALAAGTRFCIEPNPTAYACDFVTNAATGARLVRDVGHEGFGLHLDVAGMTLAGDVPADEIAAAADVLRHYHVSAPQLEELEDNVVDHRSAFAALAQIRYPGFSSIERRPGQAGEAAQRVRRAVTLARGRASDAGWAVSAAGVGRARNAGAS